MREEPVVADIMLKNPKTVRVGQTVGEAVDIMAELNIGAIPVVDENGALAGIFTERDLLRRVAAKRLPLDSTRIEEVMTPQPSQHNTRRHPRGGQGGHGTDKGETPTCGRPGWEAHRDCEPIRHRVRHILDRTAKKQGGNPYLPIILWSHGFSLGGAPGIKCLEDVSQGATWTPLASSSS